MGDYQQQQQAPPEIAYGTLCPKCQHPGVYCTQRSGKRVINCQYCKSETNPTYPFVIDWMNPPKGEEGNPVFRSNNKSGWKKPRAAPPAHAPYPVAAPPPPVAYPPIVPPPPSAPVVTDPNLGAPFFNLKTDPTKIIIEKMEELYNLSNLKIAKLSAQIKALQEQNTIMQGQIETMAHELGTSNIRNSDEEMGLGK